jgi:hypothetical protein
VQGSPTARAEKDAFLTVGAARNKMLRGHRFTYFHLI